MPLQYRRKTPRAGTRDPYYTPERDLAYIGPELVYQAIASLEPDADSIFRKFISEHEIAETDVESAVRLFAKMCAEVISEKDPDTAAKQVRFDEVDLDLRIVILSALGAIALGAIWSGVKDVNTPDAEPPAAIEDLVAQALSRTLWLRESSDDNDA